MLGDFHASSYREPQTPVVLKTPGVLLHRSDRYDARPTEILLEPEIALGRGVRAWRCYETKCDTESMKPGLPL